MALEKKKKNTFILEEVKKFATADLARKSAQQIRDSAQVSHGDNICIQQVYGVISKYFSDKTQFVTVDELIKFIELRKQLVGVDDAKFIELTNIKNFDRLNTEYLKIQELLK